MWIAMKTFCRDSITHPQVPVQCFLKAAFKKNHTHICRRWGTPQNFLSAFNDELWKTEKSEFWKNEKNPQPYEVQFLRYGVRQNIFVILGRFLPFYHPPPPSPTANNAENQNLEKNGKIIWRCHHFKLVQQKKWSYDAC